jgi:hypothetical protein
VKNVAGFDLTRLLVGSFGAFGLITSAHVRLNALPESDITLVANGPRDAMLERSRDILATGTTPAAMELLMDTIHQNNSWMLAVRLLGSETAVSADRRNIAEAASGLSFGMLDRAEADHLWSKSRTATTQASTTVRIGCRQSELQPALDLLNAALGEDSNTMSSVSVLAGVTRWSCNAQTHQLQSLRRMAAERNWPVTVERAPWEVLNDVGHYGAYRGGVGKLVTSLRRVFDRRELIVVPLGAR